jgi:hypothetical protein
MLAFFANRKVRTSKRIGESTAGDRPASPLRPGERGVLERALQLVVFILGVCCTAWAIIDPRFRDVEGFPKGTVCLPISVGVALIVLAVAVRGRWRSSAFWFALAIAGQAVALQLIDAGNRIHYQHYRPLTQPALLIFLATQAALVFAGLRSRWAAIRAWTGRHFRYWQLFGVGLAFFLSSATVSPQAPVYVAELFFAAFVQTVNLGNIILLAWSLPGDSLPLVRHKLERWFGRPEGGEATTTGGIDRFAMLAAVWVTLVAAFLSFFVYERHPHIPDEVAYLLHARYFAAGMLTMPAPPAPEAFNIDLMNYEPTRWFSPVPPGWPAVLTLGMLVGVPWLVNPLLGGVNILLAYLLVRKLYDRRSARLAVLLLCASPWHVFMAMNFMTHTLTLTCALSAAVAVIRARTTGKVLWACASGVAVGVVCLIRPLEGLAVAGLLALWIVGLGGRRLRVPAIAAFVVGTVVVGGSALPYNKRLTGDATVFPIMAYADKYYGAKSNALGFGPDRGLGWPIDPNPGHSPIDAMINANLNTFSINIELFGWSTGSLIAIALFLLGGRLCKSDYLLLAVMVAVFGVHFFYYFSGGPDFGARYWYLMLVPCVALTVRGLHLLESTFQTGGEASSSSSVRVIVMAVALSALTVMNYFPWRAVDKYHHYLFMRPDIRYLARDHGFGRSLVLVRGTRHPDYASAAIYNPLDLHADAPVYAWDRNPEVRAQALNAYRDRPVWIVDGPSITHNGFQVVGGPFSVSELLVNDE